MFPKWLIVGVVVLGSVALSGCYARVHHARPAYAGTTVSAGYAAPGVVVYHAPPAAPPASVVVHAPPTQPYAGAVWVDGHYTYNGSAYIWTNGYYVQPRQGHVYVQPRWQRRGRGYVYVQGGYQPHGSVHVQTHGHGHGHAHRRRHHHVRPGVVNVPPARGRVRARGSVQVR